MLKRWRILLLVLVPLLAIVLGGTFLFLDHVNRESLRFLETGRKIVLTLDSVSTALEKGDLETLSSFYSEDYQGTLLGLTGLEPAVDLDGIRRLPFSPNGSSAERDSGLREWQQYLTGFESIEEAGLHIHRLEKWQSGEEWVASIRFELIGRPKEAPRAGIDRALFRMVFKPGEDGPLIRSASLIEGERLISETPQFLEVSEDVGIGFVNREYPAFLTEPLRFGMIRYGPAGITTADYDNDGFYDLFIPDGEESKLFHNMRNGTFADVTQEAGLAGLDGVSVGLFADYDNDGHKDFFVSRTFQPNQLFHGNGDGTFTDVTIKSGIGADCCTTVASWADYDNDGLLDLYVGRYLDPRTAIPTTFYARNGLPNQLYRNNGDGTFTNVTDSAGVGEKGLCLGTVFGDYNNDGFPDLYVVNDFGRNTLYRNNGDGTFTDVTTETGTLDYGAGMNASFGDYDNDGGLDIYVTNIRSEHAWFAEAPTIYRYMLNSFTQGVWITDMPLYFEIFQQSGFSFIEVFQQMASGNSLLQNQGDGTFKDVTWDASANPPGWYWSASFADFDNDGWQDLYAANGWVYNDPGTEIELEFLNNVVSRQKDYKTGVFFSPEHFGRKSWHGWERNRLLHNNGDGTFLEMGLPSGSGLILNSRGVAVADYWNRGVLDIAVSASTDQHAFLRNEMADQRNWLEVELVGTQSNRDAVGARVTIHSDNGEQMRELVLGDGYGSQNTLRLHFGLGQAKEVDKMVVKWPRSGIVQTFEEVEANQIVQISEGEDLLTPRTYQAELQ